MRQIAFLTLEDNDPLLWELLLDFCSQYTPLVEPLADKLSVYLDLSGCGDALSIIRAVASSMRAYSRQAQMRAGLAVSRLLARLAIQSSLHYCPAGSYQVFSDPGLLLVKVPAGCEKDFINPLPLKDLFFLSGRVSKTLFRLGFMNTGELACLSAGQLAQLNIENPRLLIQHINGIDHSPVAGLYPPSRIVYPLAAEEDLADRVRLETRLKEAAFRLEKLLEERHAACQRIILQIRSETETLVRERHLSSYCCRSDQLFNILLSLLPREYTGKDDWEMQIILQDITSLSFCQPDLFLSRVLFNKQEQEMRVKEIMQNLQTRFPGCLRQGLEINRRERALAFWDPWRKGRGPA